MKGSHAPAFAHLVERCLGEFCQLPAGAGLVVGVSGGPDSMALLHALTLCRERLDFTLSALAVDHGLRPAAREELALAADFSARLGVPFRALTLEVQAGPNLQERARQARYEALWQAARERFGPEVFLATAHHKDDRAETVLLRLLRGTSLAGLGVLSPRDDRLLRPAIFADRQSIVLHNERHAVPSSVDPSNVDRRFLRARVRHELLPLLEQLAPGIVERLCQLAEEASLGDPALGLNSEQRNQLRRALSGPATPIDLWLPRGLRLRREATPRAKPRGG